MAPPIFPCIDKEVPPPEDIQSKSSDEEDPYGPPNEVAPDPPTLEWFWVQNDICLWKSLPLVEKARQVAFKKKMSEEKARYHAACESHESAWKKETVGLWALARRRAEEVYADVYFARKVKGARCLSATWRWVDKLHRATDE
ncbi:Actin-related protein 2 [Hordeum vulgare]|nr:Actin-related protein 2 [Hordeum vulgare]